MRPRAPKPERDQQSDESGFTLVELLVGITMSLVILAAGFTILQIVERSEPEIRDRNATIQDAQIASERMAQELRQTFAVNSASATNLSVNTYLQQAASCAGGGGTTARQCRVVYACSSTACTRTVSELDGSGATTTTVASGLLSGNVFSFSPSATNPLTIGVTLRFSDEGGEDGITVTDGVALRNVSGAVGT